MLKTRFGNLPGWPELRIDSARESGIERWTERLFAADRIEYVFDS